MNALQHFIYTRKCADKQSKVALLKTHPANRGDAPQGRGLSAHAAGRKACPWSRVPDAAEAKFGFNPPGFGGIGDPEGEQNHESASDQR
jgi:hypothetical protein